MLAMIPNCQDSTCLAQKRMPLPVQTSGRRVEGGMSGGGCEAAELRAGSQVWLLSLRLCRGPGLGSQEASTSA